jgi:branched-chain amino acid transport system substrate-binding protein
MSKMRRAAVALMCVTALAATTSGLSGCAADESSAGSGTSDTKAHGGDITIGASLELSGPTQSIGTAYKKALELEVADLNKKGGVLGGRKIRLIVKDNQTRPDQNIVNVNGFIRNDHVAAVVTGGCSACTVPVTSIVEKEKVPMIALSSASAVTQPVAQRQYTFKISPNPAQDAEVLLSDLKSKGVKSIGLLNVDNPYGQDGRKSVVALAKKDGIKVVSAQQFGQDDKDMSVQAKALAGAHPDAIVVWAVMPAAGIVAKDIKETGFKGGTYLDAGAGAELFIKGAQDAAEGTHLVFPRVLGINDDASDTSQVRAQKQWVKEYTAKYGIYSGFASFAGDALIMLTKAIDKAQSTDGPKVRDSLETLGFDGLSGPIQNSATEHSGLQQKALAVLEVKNGQWHLSK